MAILPSSTTSVVRYAAGLYGVKLGNATLQAVQSDLGANPLVSLPAVLNAYYAPFAGKTSAQVAAIVVANAGIVAGQYGLTATNVADAVAIVTTALNSAAPLGNQGVAISNVLAGWSNDSPSDPVYGAAATAWNLKIAQSTGYANSAGTSDVAFGAVVTEFRLSAGGENRTGTEGDDTFIAVQGTFDNADRINGGAGFDTLKAQVSTAANGVVAPNVSNVEHLQFQAQHRSSDSGDNNLVGDSSVKVDFNTNVTNVTGFTTIENNNSRADLIVEDVRIASGQITKDITIAMRDTDPGNVDYGVYFDQNSLRNQSASTSTIRLQVMDTKSVVDGTAPLLNSPYGGFKFTATDSKGVAQVVTLQSAAIDNAQTYAELRTAFQAAADVAFGVGVVTVSLGAAFTVTDTTTGAQVSGTEINLSASGSFTFTTPTGSGWIANGVVPANSGLHTNFNTGGVTNTDLVTSKIVLDNVGRGSNGGDLVVGGLSVGTTSTSKGVQQFDITVEDNSKLQTISSTNNALQVVKIVNGTTNEQSDAYITTVQNKGNLTVNGTVGTADTVLPGATSATGAAGFTDVRVIDASAMTGKLAFTAAFTEKAVAKYVNLVDTDGNPAADTVAVVYTGGSNNDTMVVNLDGKAVASNSNINVGREDFTFAFNGGAGDDSIDVAIDRGAETLIGGAQNWYNNQVINKNLTINGGDGNDTIRKPGAGNAVINGDGGNDVIYADNTGVQAAIASLDATGAGSVSTRKATWVFNTAVQAVDDAVAQNLYDLKSAASKTVGSYGTKVTVDYRGLTAQVAVADTADYKLSDLEVNQAIKKAINSDAVLNKLLVAEDGPAGTLVVTALTDGVHSNTSLAVTFNTLASTDLNATILSAYNAANGTALADTTALATAIATNVNDNAAGLKLQYVTQTADSTGGVDIVGAASVTTSDNKITGGAGDDVIVLGTTVGVDAASAIDDSNDTVVFSGSFGNDVVLNFVANAANAGKDVLDFKAFLGSANTTVTALLADANAAAANTDSLITLGTLDITGVALTGVRNDSAAEIAKLYTDDATANKGLYITVNTATNVGTVYQVVDGTAASDLTVTLMGSVDLADTAWSTLVLANFA